MDNLLTKDDALLEGYQKTNDIVSDMRWIIETSQRQAYQAVNQALVRRNWMIGRRIAEEELGGDGRAEYGNSIIKKLSQNLTQLYGKGFDYSSLYKFLRFYRTYPNILDSESPKSRNMLSWTHYRILLQVNDGKARDWYENEAFEQGWSVRTLQRNISTQYYYRLLASREKELVEAEMRDCSLHRYR